MRVAFSIGPSEANQTSWAYLSELERKFFPIMAMSMKGTESGFSRLQQDEASP